MFWVISGLAICSIVAAVVTAMRQPRSVKATPEQRRQALKKGESLATTAQNELSRSNQSLTTSTERTMTLSHPELPLEIELLASTDEQEAKISGVLPGRSGLKELYFRRREARWYEAMNSKQTIALYQASLEEYLFGGNHSHTLINFNLDGLGKLSMTVSWPDEPDIEELTRWLAPLQDDLSRDLQDWHRTLLQRVYITQAPRHAIRMTRYLVMHCPEEARTLIDDLSDLSDGARVVLLEEHHRSTNTALSNEDLEYLIDIISDEARDDTLRISAMSACVNTPHSTYPHALFSETGLTLLRQHTNPCDDLLELLPRLTHKHAEDDLAQLTILLSHLERLDPRRVEQIITNWLAQSWELHDDTTISRALKETTSPLGKLGSLLVFGRDLERAASLSQELLTQPALSKSSHLAWSQSGHNKERFYTALVSQDYFVRSTYLLWEHLTRYRRDELCHNVNFMTWLTTQIGTRSHHADQLFRSLVLDLGTSPLMKESMEQLLANERPRSLQMWERYGRLFCQHVLTIRTDLVSIALQLIDSCPDRDDARKFIAQLPEDNASVQNFLLIWPATPYAQRRQVLRQLAQCPGPLSDEHLTSLISLLQEEGIAAAHHKPILSLIAEKGDLATLKALQSLREVEHIETFEASLENAVEHIKERLGARGGELTLSQGGDRKGGLSQT